MISSPSTRARASLATVVLGSLLALAAACSGAGAGPASSPSPTQQAQVKTGNPARPVTITESGSSLLLPYLQKLGPQLQAQYSNIQLSPAAGGSGKGISDAIAGAVIMGGSDAYLSDAQAQQNPDLLDIPIAVSAQLINYNLPGISNLHLSGDVLAKIYMGKITTWDDAAIKSLNPGASLPHTTIVPVRRIDSSGDTFIFTSFLTKTSAEWANGPALGTSVSWPDVQGEVTASGNPAMIQVCKGTPGCIAYIGVSVRQAAEQAGLGEALLKNRAGRFVSPDQGNITAAVNAQTEAIPKDLRQSLIYGPGEKSYPIVNYEYVLARSQQPEAGTGLAVRTFLTWAISPRGGATAANLQAVNFVALTPAAENEVKKEIAKIRP
ncbi:MAG: phosphate ABC transporter substrate-binding protein PstS [Candidatus Dormibacteraeota bacterium]|nr:phosphate ABC transporter substrate-binding protein PstS [Candidatus Dormibacteraeota bacterium]